MMRSFGARCQAVFSSNVIPLLFVFAQYYLGVLWCFDRYLNANTPFTLIATFALVLLPIVCYIGMKSPFIVPLCLYILVMPFDALSYLGSLGTLTKILGILTAGAIIVHISRRDHFVVPPRSLIGWLALLTLMSASMFWSIQQANAMIYLQMYASLIFLYALLSIVRLRKFEFDAILSANMLAGVISATFETYLFRSNQNLVHAPGAMRVIITSGGSSIDPNEFAFALVLPFAIALFWLFNSKFTWLRVLMLPVIAIDLLGFAASGSRGGFIALGAVFVYLIVRSRHRLWLAALQAICVICALLANPGLPARFLEAQQDGAAGRSDIWRIGVHAFRNHWLFGAGVGNFADAFDREYIRVFARYVLGWGWVAHNVPLTIATELGVIGLAVYATAYIFQLTSLRDYSTGTRLYELRLSLEAACIGIFIAGLSTSTLNAKFAWLVFSMMSLMRGYQIAYPSGTRTENVAAWSMKSAADADIAAVQPQHRERPTGATVAAAATLDSRFLK